jgi:hypothetical protein
MTVLAAVLAAALAAPAAPTDAGPAAAKRPSPPAARAIPAEGPEGVRALFERELPTLAKRRFETPLGISGQVEAAAAPTVQATAQAAALTIPLGTGQPITCSLFPTRIGVGETFWRLVEAAQKNVKVVAALPAEVVAVDGSALVLAQVVYQLESEKGPLAGQMKLAALAHPSHSLLCVHDEPGYSATFARLVKGLAASLAGGPRDERADAVFAELSVLRVGNLPVGFGERAVWRRKEGGLRAEEHGTQLLPRGPADLVTLDSVSVEELDRGDLLARGTFAQVTNGELDGRMVLVREPDGKTYRYDGEKDGKPLQGTFATAGGISSDLWLARRLARSAPAPKGDLVHEGYSMSSNPVAPVSVAWRPDPASPRRGTLEVGALRISGDLADDGMLRVGEMPVGPAKLVVERVWSRGAP